MTEQQLYRRLVRRTIFRSRSAAVILALAVTALVAVYVGIESVLAALELPALLVSPADFVNAVNTPSTLTLGIAAAAAAVGLILVLVAVIPSRRGRHELPNDRMAVVVDDSVLAGAIGAAVTREAGVPTSRVASMVSRTRGEVRVTPTSGSPLDSSALETSAHALVATLAPKPQLRVAVTVAGGGVVGS